MALPQHRSNLLSGRTILIVEDEYFLAQDLARELEGAGALIVGPASNVEDALDLVEETASLDGAVLDVNLQGVMVYPVADALRQRGVPVVFITGYDAGHIPPAYRDIAFYQKPVASQVIAEILFDQQRVAL